MPPALGQSRAVEWGEGSSPSTSNICGHRKKAVGTDFSRCCIIVKVCPVLSDVGTPENVHSLGRPAQKVAADVVQCSLVWISSQKGARGAFSQRLYFSILLHPLQNQMLNTN